MITKTMLYQLNKLPERFIKKISITSGGCWEWNGELNRNGYGRLYFNGTRFMSHRFIYSFLRKEIKEGMVLDHLCSNRKCCNPSHLSEITQKQNVHRGKVVLIK